MSLIEETPTVKVRDRTITLAPLQVQATHHLSDVNHHQHLYFNTKKRSDEHDLTSEEYVTAECVCADVDTDEGCSDDDDYVWDDAVGELDICDEAVMMRNVHAHVAIDINLDGYDENEAIMIINTGKRGVVADLGHRDHVMCDDHQHVAIDVNLDGYERLDSEAIINYDYDVREGSPVDDGLNECSIIAINDDGYGFKKVDESPLNLEPDLLQTSAKVIPNTAPEELEMEILVDNNEDVVQDQLYSQSTNLEIPRKSDDSEMVNNEERFTPQSRFSNSAGQSTANDNDATVGVTAQEMEKTETDSYAADSDEDLLTQENHELVDVKSCECDYPSALPSDDGVDYVSNDVGDMLKASDDEELPSINTNQQEAGKFDYILQRLEEEAGMRFNPSTSTPWHWMELFEKAVKFVNQGLSDKAADCFLEAFYKSDPTLFPLRYSCFLGYMGSLFRAVNFKNFAIHLNYLRLIHDDINELVYIRAVASLGLVFLSVGMCEYGNGSYWLADCFKFCDIRRLTEAELHVSLYESTLLYDPNDGAIDESKTTRSVKDDLLDFKQKMLKVAKDSFDILRRKQERLHLTLQDPNAGEFANLAASIGFNLPVLTGMECANCGVKKFTLNETAGDAEQVKLKKCKKCRRVAYCSKNCQREDWMKGHGAVCKEAGKFRVGDVIMLKGMEFRNGEALSGRLGCVYKMIDMKNVELEFLILTIDRRPEEQVIRARVENLILLIPVEHFKS
ncbi:hypothetical protein HDU76_005350 [Blyttiomyces sp. JEL0837]|nr:hypothetical protein HDU76_005350 [Blyttiomyces sp. JEL0837]